MSETKDTIHIQLFSNSKGHIKSNLDSESIETIQELYRKGKKDLYFQRITEKKARSNNQNGYYWKNVLRIICEHVDGMDRYATHRDNGTIDYTRAHRYLTLKFALEHGRTDLIEPVKTYYKDKWIDVAITSFSFDRMKHEDATKYIKWLEDKLIAIVGCGFDMILENEK
jgi:hypothetical protein